MKNIFNYLCISIARAQGLSRFKEKVHFSFLITFTEMHYFFNALDSIHSKHLQQIHLLFWARSPIHFLSLEKRVVSWLLRRGGLELWVLISTALRDE